MQPRQSALSAAQSDIETMADEEIRSTQWEDSSKNVLLMPAVLIVLFLSVFPSILSLLTSLTRIRFVQGGLEINFVGFANYDKLLMGSESRHFLGRFTDLELPALLVLFAFVCVMFYMFYKYATSERRTTVGLVMRVITVAIATWLVWLSLSTLTGRGLPGTLVVTLIFVFSGVTIQYLLGLGLAMLVTQPLPFRRFFRVIFLLPMMITPVGIGFLFKMIVDTVKGPFSPVWNALGLVNFSWVDTAHGARTAVMIGDIWQWTPFMFIILLAALEGVPNEPVEAATVDGANRWQIFRYITLPQIVPVSTTVILIRLIEAFKMIDMPQVLTNGGPGTATEPLTLHSYGLWRALDLGTSSALSYLLLFIVTFIALVFVNIVRRRLLEVV